MTSFSRGLGRHTKMTEFYFLSITELYFLSIRWRVLCCSRFPLISCVFFCLLINPSTLLFHKVLDINELPWDSVPLYEVVMLSFLLSDNLMGNSWVMICKHQNQYLFFFIMGVVSLLQQTLPKSLKDPNTTL